MFYILKLFLFFVRTFFMSFLYVLEYCNASLVIVYNLEAFIFGIVTCNNLEIPWGKKWKKKQLTHISFFLVKKRTNKKYVSAL